MENKQGRAGEAPGAPLLVPRPSGVFRRFSVAHPRIVDALVALISLIPAAIAVLASAQSTEEDLNASVPYIAASSVACSAALLWRRSRPLVPVIVCAVSIAIPLGFALGPIFALYFALYAAGAYARTGIAWVALAIVAFGSAVGTVLQTEPIGSYVIETAVAIAFATTTYLVAMLLGSSTRARRAYVEQLIARAEDLNRDREREASLAVAAERARIAREMHDVVSHGLTVMTTIADGSARLIDRSPERAREGMQRVSETGRESLAEMRRLLGVLREPGSETDRTPQPTAGDLTPLIASFRTAGMPVHLTTSGQASDEQHVALAVHRIVQEALTNVLRHASDAKRVRVTVEHRARAVRIEVTDDGEGGLASTAGAGRGLIGIRERVALFGGTVEAGPMVGGGWRLEALLPRGRKTSEESAT